MTSMTASLHQIHHPVSLREHKRAGRRRDEGGVWVDGPGDVRGVQVQHVLQNASFPKQLNRFR